MIMLQSEGHGCIYSIDSEGVLYMSPQYQNGTVNLEDWIEVESVDELDEEGVKEIHEKLITMMKAIGWYFSN